MILLKIVLETCIYSCDYLKRLSVETNVATDEGNRRKETWQWTGDEIGVAVQSSVCVRVQIMAW